jgi:hypothetical protein
MELLLGWIGGEVDIQRSIVKKEGTKGRSVACIW